MRFASAVVSILLLAASTALAAPPASDPGVATPHQARTQPNPGADDAARRSPTPDQASPRKWRARFPGYGSGTRGDQSAQSNCYIVFGELRCDRLRYSAASETR